VTTAFTVVGKQILSARGGYRDIVDTEDGTPPSVSQLLEVAAKPEIEADGYWSDWTADYNYVYFLFTRPGYQNPDPLHLQTEHVGNGFALYRILPPDRSAPDPELPPAQDATAPDVVASAGIEPNEQVARLLSRIRHGAALKLRHRVN
jgi:hypothetical protein